MRRLADRLSGGGGRELEAEIHLTFTPKEGRRLAASVAVRFG